jgi:coenzyme A diphosphatase NUDT7
MQGVKSKQESCSLRSICVVHRAPVGQWARASDEMIWGLWSSVRMTASVPNDNGVKWPVTVRRASVLVCLFEGAAGELRVILTKRAGRLSSHSGEVALPGGKRDEEDEDDIATALREAKEEIGLEPSQVRVVAVFEPFLSKYLLTVTPVVGVLLDKSKFEPIANPSEVESVFDVPLEMFLKVQYGPFSMYEYL